MISKLRSQLEQLELDYFLVTGSANLSYLLGDGQNSSERIEGCLIIGKDRVQLLTSNFYRYYSTQLASSDQIDHAIYTDQQEREDLLSDLQIGGKLVTDAQGERYHQLQQTFPDLEQSQLLAQLRVKKRDAELDKIKKACKLTEKAMQAVRDALEPGITEIELALLADKTIRRAGSDVDNAFPTLVQANSLQPHRKPQDQRISKHDLVIVDLGAEYQGYCSDMTRTFCLNPDQNKKDIFHTIKEGYDLAIDKLEPGTSFSQVEKQVKNLFSKKGYDLKRSYLHSLGHGVGLQAHEPPFVNKSKEQETSVGNPLDKGMVVAVEPALYLPHLGGIRIEDTLLIKKDGNKEKLTSAPYRL